MAVVLSLRSMWCHGYHVNANASEATIIITFNSQAHVIQAHKYCTKIMVDFSICFANLESIILHRTWFQLSAGQVFGKIVSKQMWIESLN